MLKITNSASKYSIFVGDSEEEAFHALNFDMTFIMVDRYGRYSNSKTSKFPIVKNLNGVLKTVKKMVIL